MEPEAFYDKFTKKLITDYLINNRRMIAAIKFTLDWIPSTSKNVIDIGCGIGWSTHEMSTHYPDTHFKGIDLSNNSIDVANTLFKRENNSFEKVDVTKQDFTTNNSFDAIVMLDVLEHIPIADRYHFIESLNSILTPRGRFIVSCPTVLHQNHLKEIGEGLQPVDEDITIDTLQQIAKQLEGDIIYFKSHSLANTNDYFHAVIEKNIQYQKAIWVDSFGHFDLEAIPDRINRVQQSKYIDFYANEEFTKFTPWNPNIETSDKLKTKIKNILSKIKNKLKSVIKHILK